MKDHADSLTEDKCTPGVDSGAINLEDLADDFDTER
jgi:hypothetical protein